MKKHERSIKIHYSPGGGVGPKHSAFCGGCFSINSNSVIFGPIKSKSDQKNTEPSTFSKIHKIAKNDQKVPKIDNYRKLINL
jgi:hypothetical protein